MPSSISDYDHISIFMCEFRVTLHPQILYFKNINTEMFAAKFTKRNRTVQLVLWTVEGHSITLVSGLLGSCSRPQLTLCGHGQYCPGLY